MIKLFSGARHHHHPGAMDEMFRLRKRVFHDLLKWQVLVDGEWEIDQYDLSNPVYVLSYDDETGKLRGTLRLLPTVGPNMLNDTFPVLLGVRPAIRDAAIWESSRFCIDPEISQDRASNQVTVAAAELMCGVGELGLTSGLKKIVTVTDVFLERMFRRMGCPGERLGEPHKIGTVHAVAVSWNINTAMLYAMRDVAGLAKPVLEAPTTVALARAA